MRETHNAFLDFLSGLFVEFVVAVVDGGGGDSVEAAD